MAPRSGDWLYYGYVPTKPESIALLVLFSVTTLAHIVQAIRSRIWWLLPTAGLCGVMEILGWAARVWSSSAPYNRTPYLIQTIVTILAPTPFIAANFVILRLIIDSLGSSYSRISPKWYAIIFSTSDVLSLIVQGAGGGLAAGASTSAGTKLGGHIALAGIVFQTSIIIVFICCAIEFFVRYNKNVPVQTKNMGPTPTLESPLRGRMDVRLMLMSVAMMFSTTCLLIRALYRTVELGDGWNGRIIRTEVYFVVLDGIMIVIAMMALNFAHPGILLRPAKRITSSNSSNKI